MRYLFIPFAYLTAAAINLFAFIVSFLYFLSWEEALGACPGFDIWDDDQLVLALGLAGMAPSVVVILHYSHFWK